MEARRFNLRMQSHDTGLRRFEKMSGMRELYRMPHASIVSGELEGMGHEPTPCQVLTWKTSDLSISRFRVIEAPLSFQDGRYTLKMNGHSYKTEKQNGWWDMEVLSERE